MAVTVGITRFIFNFKNLWYKNLTDKKIQATTKKYWIKEFRQVLIYN